MRSEGSGGRGGGTRALERDQLLACVGAMELALWVSLSLSLGAGEWGGVRRWLRSCTVPRRYNVFTTETDSHTRAYYWPSKPPHCSASERGSGEAGRHRLQKHQPALLTLGVAALGANIWITAGKRRPVRMSCDCLHSPFFSK